MTVGYDRGRTREDEIAEALAWIEKHADRLRDTGQWVRKEHGPASIRCSMENGQACPLSALDPVNRRPAMPGAHAEALGIPPGVAIRLVDAADGRCAPTDPIRLALLTQLGLPSEDGLRPPPHPTRHPDPEDTA